MSSRSPMDFDGVHGDLLAAVERSHRARTMNTDPSRAVGTVADTIADACARTGLDELQLLFSVVLHLAMERQRQDNCFVLDALGEIDEMLSGGSA